MRKSLHKFYFAGMLLLAGLFIQTNALAQKSYWWGEWNIPYVEPRGWSIGFNFGETDFWGDVGTKSIIDHYNNSVYTNDITGNMRFMGGIFTRYNAIPGLAFRLGVNYGSLYATDKWNKDAAMKAKTIEADPFQRYLRNLDFSTNIWEANLLVEFSPLEIGGWEFSKMAKWSFQPYLIAGISGFHFNSTGTLKNFQTGKKQQVDLQPLHTEGESFQAPGYTFPENYNLYSYAGIAGIGIRFGIGKHRRVAIGLEYKLRFTATDYLDDVSGNYIDPQFFDIANLNKHGRNKVAKKMADKSQEIMPGYKHAPGDYRGNPNDNDKFSTLSIIFYWNIDKRWLPWWK